MGRKIILFQCLILVASFHLTSLSSQGFAQQPVYKAETGFHLDWWDSPNREKGLQYYLPMKLQVEYGNFEAGVLTGWCYTSYDPVGDDRRSMADLLDTKLNFGYALLDKLPFDLMFGLDFNLPTGRTKLSDEDLYLMMDPDLVSITSFGEGFNVNPTISLSKEWGDWMLGVGLGYIYRGEYDYGHSFHDYDPGDIYTITTQIMYFFQESWRFRAFTNFSIYETDELDNDDFYEEGDYFQWGLAAMYYRPEYDVELSVQNVLRGKSEFSETGTGHISKESDNSHGDEWITSLRANYRPNDLTAFKFFVTYLYIDENDYPESSIYYIGKREKISFGASVVKMIIPHLSGELGAKGFFMQDDETWAHPDSKQSYRGFSIEIKLVSTF